MPGWFVEHVGSVDRFAGGDVPAGIPAGSLQNFHSDARHPGTFATAKRAFGKLAFFFRYGTTDSRLNARELGRAPLQFDISPGFFFEREQERSWTSLPSEVISGCQRHRFPTSDDPSSGRANRTTVPLPRPPSSSLVIPLFFLSSLLRPSAAACPRLPVSPLLSALRPPSPLPVRHRTVSAPAALPLSVTGYDLPFLAFGRVSLVLSGLHSVPSPLSAVHDGIVRD